MNFGEKIKQLRIEKEWTQEYVANQLNISMGALSRYETGMYEPKSLDLIKDFSILFDVSTDYLLGTSNERHPYSNIDSDLIRIGLSKKVYGDPTENQKKQIEDFAKYVLKDNKKKED